MKKSKQLLSIISIMLITSALFSACGNRGNKSESENSNQLNEQSSNDSNESEDTNKSNSNTSSEVWDNMLNDYEKYVDEYIKFYKKALKGDQNALVEYPTLMEKAIVLQESIAKAQKDGKLNPDHMVRMMKIQTKMLEAISNG